MQAGGRAGRATEPQLIPLTQHSLRNKNFFLAALRAALALRATPIPTPFRDERSHGKNPNWKYMIRQIMMYMLYPLRGITL